MEMQLHCCSFMEYFFEKDKKFQESDICIDDPDNILHYNMRFEEYGIMVFDGGGSYITIKYCPWCGSKLPESRRDTWFDELEKLGFKSPLDETIPKEYQTDLWWRIRSSE